MKRIFKKRCFLSLIVPYCLTAVLCFAHENVLEIRQGDDSLGISGKDLLAKAVKEEKKKESPRGKKIIAGKKNVVSDAEKDIYLWFKTYSEVVSLAEKKAFRSVDFSKFIQGSLKTAVAEVDAHSAFLNKESYKAAMETTSGEFSGIGVSIISKTPDDDALVIIDVIPGGPAEKAGLRSGDKIVEADGNKFKGLSSDEAINKLKGKAGSYIKIKIIRNKKPLEMKVKRDIIKDQSSICYLFPKHHVYYFSLKIFTENAAAQMSELLQIANAGKCKGIVLDLRRNPGGILQSAIEMSALFVDKNSLIAVTKDNKRKVVDKYFTSTEPVLKTDVPVFVLIDNFTASAAEILAGSLRHHSMQSYEKKGKKGRNLLVFLVGTTTFGKGSVQEVIPISNGCALKLTTMLYYLPDDLSIQATGIEPDFLIKPKFVPVDELRWINEMYGKESSMKHHITSKEATGKESEKDKKEVKKTKDDDESSVLDEVEFDLEAAHRKGIDDEDDKKDDSPQKWEERQKEALGHDVQVQAAVNLISMLAMARKCDASLVDTREKALVFLKKHYVTDDKVEVEKVK